MAHRHRDIVLGPAAAAVAVAELVVVAAAPEGMNSAVGSSAAVRNPVGSDVRVVAASPPVDNIGRLAAGHHTHLAGGMRQYFGSGTRRPDIHYYCCCTGVGRPRGLGHRVHALRRVVRGSQIPFEQTLPLSKGAPPSDALGDQTCQSEYL